MNQLPLAAPGAEEEFRRVEVRRYWDLDFPDAGEERRLADPTPLVDELEGLLGKAVERRLRGQLDRAPFGARLLIRMLPGPS